MKNPSTLTIALFSITLGCGEPITPEPEPAPARDGFDGLIEASRGFGADPYGIGSSWYNYDGATHSVTPKLEVYVAQRGQSLALIELLSYYDDRGESGIFTLRGDAFDGSTWSGETRLSTQINVKEEMTCLSIAPIEEVGCADADAALVLRSSWRTLPDAGFSVREPALLARTHFAWPEEERTSLNVLTGTTLDDVARDVTALTEMAPLPNAGLDPTASRVGWVHDAPGVPAREDANVQFTANMQMVHWRITNLDGLAMTFEKRCQASSLSDQQALPSQTQEATVALDPGSYSGALVQLCDPESHDAAPTIVGTLDAPFAGTWPDTKTFDLLVEQVEGRFVVRPAPGNILTNWTRHAQAEGFDAPDVDSVWDSYMAIDDEP